MKNTIIFDLDGLLIDSETISYRIYRDLTGNYHKDISMEEYIHDYSGKTEIRNMQTLIGAYGLPISLEDGLAFAKKREKEYFLDIKEKKFGERGRIWEKMFPRRLAFLRR